MEVCFDKFDAFEPQIGIELTFFSVVLVEEAFGGAREVRLSPLFRDKVRIPDGSFLLALFSVTDSFDRDLSALISIRVISRELCLKEIFIRTAPFGELMNTLVPLILVQHNCIFTDNELSCGGHLAPFGVFARIVHLDQVIHKLCL